MLDMSHVIIPKSDQQNADDFISGPKTFTIEAVQISPGAEQPIQVKLVGEQRVWRPCKSMARVLVAAWGPDAKVYNGRSLTLYRDPKVKWGGVEVGGIRVSHLSHIERPLSMALTATKGRRADYTVKPLVADVAPIRQPEPEPDAAVPTPEQASEMILNTATMDELVTVWKTLAATRRAYPDHIDALTDLKDAKKLELVESV